MKAKKTARTAKGKTIAKKKTARATPARKTAAAPKQKTATGKRPATAKAAAEKYSQPGAPWWKAHL